MNETVTDTKGESVFFSLSHPGSHAVITIVAREMLPGYKLDHSSNILPVLLLIDYVPIDADTEKDE